MFAGFLEKEIKKDGIPMLDVGDNPEAPQPREMIDLEATYEKLENELKEVNTNAEALKKTFLELTELRHILAKTQQFFDEVIVAGHRIRLSFRLANRLTHAASYLFHSHLLGLSSCFEYLAITSMVHSITG